MTTQQVDSPSCTDGCKTPLPAEQDPARGAWTYLEITKRWRCPACRRELEAANERDKENGDDK